MICGKIIYKSRNIAIDAIKGIDKNLRVYFCEDCLAYHITSENKKKKRRQFKIQTTRKEMKVESIGLKKNNERQRTLIIHQGLKFKIT